MQRMIVVVFILALASVAYAQPEIKFDAETHDMGNVMQEIVKHSFEFKNTGSSELIIKRLYTS